MKWEEIKNRVAGELYSMIEEGRTPVSHILQDLLVSDWRVLRDLPTGEKRASSIRRKYAEEARQRVLNWDIRSAGTLRHLFPELFPVKLREGPLECYIREPDGEWVVERRQLCAS